VGAGTGKPTIPGFYSAVPAKAIPATKKVVITLRVMVLSSDWFRIAVQEVTFCAGEG
jgi:hypothetical protein